MRALAADDFIEGQCLFNSYNSPTFVVDGKTFTATGLYISQERDGKTCYFPGSCLQANIPIDIRIEGLSLNCPAGDVDCYEPQRVDFKIYKDKVFEKEKKVNISNNIASLSESLVKDEYYSVEVTHLKIWSMAGSLHCDIKKTNTFILAESCSPDSCSTTPIDSTGQSYDLCLMQISASNPEAFNNCVACFDSGGMWTAVGCIPRTPQKIISTLIQIGLVFSGAIVLIMILAGAFMLSTSQGDLKKTQDAKELITSAIIGLLFIIFSVTILQFIGASAIKIPGFGE